MKTKKSLLAKILLLIGVPVTIIFCLTILIVLKTVSQSVTELNTNNLASQSQAASHEISNYFMKYFEIVNQMAANTQFQDSFNEVTSGMSYANIEKFPELQRAMASIQSTDSENMMACWIADVDASQLFQHDGYLSKPDWVITKRPWFIEMKEKQGAVLTNPYEDSVTKKQIVSVAAPIFKKGTTEIIGAVGIDFTIDTVIQMINNYKLGNTGFYILSTGTGQLLYHPDKNLINKNVSESGMSENIISAITNKTIGNISYTALGNTNFGYVSAIGDTGWTITTGLPKAEFDGTYYKVQTTVLVIFSIALLILIVILLFLSRSIVNPLKKLKVAANQIADGNLDVSVDTKSQDEIGQVADALSRTVVRLKDYIVYIDEISNVLDQIALGNLRFELQQDYVGEFAKIKKALENIKFTLVKTLSEIAISANQVSGGSDQIASGSQALSQGATEQASSIQELSATISEISEQVKKNAENAGSANKKAAAVSNQMTQANNNMNQLVTAMGEISDASNKIGKIIKTIEDIAFQTNILALNAAVEAARAGAAGKGFAVVADEVRNLASKSGEAAKDTTELIESTIRAVENGAEIANNAAKNLVTVIAGAEDIVRGIDEISNASNEQAISITQVMEGIDQVSAVIQTNSATAEESAASSEELSSQAQILKSLLQQFKISDQDTATPVSNGINTHHSFDLSPDNDYAKY